MRSQNGWPVISSSGLWTGHPLFGAVRKGDVYIVMHWLTHRFDTEVERIDRRQSGGYNKRKIAGSTKWSNHASGTAVDLNWRKHPVGGAHTGFSSSKVQAIGLIVKAARGVIRWGGPAFNDPMHFEIAPGVTKAQVHKLRVILLQQHLKRAGLYTGAIDGIRGKKTRAAVRAYRKRIGLTTISSADGRRVWNHLIKE